MRRIGKVCLIGVLSLCAAAGVAGPTELDGTPIEPGLYRAYETNWRRYAQYAAEMVGGGYVYIPHYDRRMPSSLLMSTSDAMSELTEREERAGSRIEQETVRRPPREDAEAYSRALPSLKIGAYGFVASAQIVEVIDDKQMIVQELWLVDTDVLREQYEQDKQRMERRNNGEADRDELMFRYKVRISLKELQEDRDAGFDKTFRLVGYDTRGLRVGSRWEGPNSEGFQVGVAGWETPEPDEDEDRRRRRRDEEPRLVLTEVAETMRETLGEEAFKGLLNERKMSVVTFVDVMRNLRERDRRNSEERIMNMLLAPDRVEE